MPRIKLVIWDLDNTLWDGTVFYKDKEAINIKPGTKAALKELDKRGISSAVCSKNDYKDGEEMLHHFDLMKYFKELKIGWDLKSKAILELIEKFHVQPEETLFVDDDAFQRAEVQNTIPGINVLELKDPLDVLDVPGIRPENATEVDSKRVFILKQQRDREEAEKSFSGSYKDFLETCAIRMRARFANEADLPRVVQLLNRTNELNATTNRYSFEEIAKDYKQSKINVLVSELGDRFGEYGLIAECIFEQEGKDILIRDLAVSCRTMGRGIGGAMLLTLLNHAKEAGFETVTGYIHHTESNWRMKPLYEKRGFEEFKKEKDKTFFRFNLKTQSLKEMPSHLKIEFDKKLKIKA